MSRVEATETEPAGLASLRRRFQAWRAGKGSGKSTPQNLLKAPPSSTQF